ncbi:hypothetical protein C4J81_02685 [Deltaproteobacteria bacterium Smac51]|nr:hypothetical protein C4J81_02685 [Deltaproteobacteria bacterium Smac51]
MEREPGGRFTAAGLAKTINNNPESDFWAMIDQDDSGILYVFSKEGGDNNNLSACELGPPGAVSERVLNCFDFQNVESGQWSTSGASFTLGGEKWASLAPMRTKAQKGQEVWNVTLAGRDVGQERDLWIAGVGDLITPGLEKGFVNGMDRDAFHEIQNAADAPWAGAEVRTQSSAQEALDAITEAIVRKDKIRADLGSFQNRLENTMTNLEIQSENLMASESRISDTDVATEMTRFVREQILSQAGISMLSQANSMSQLTLSLLQN